MSMAKCKCDKIFDTDEESNFDERGECCCNDCEMKMYEELLQDLKDVDNVEIENIAEHLINLGYRKVN